MTEKPIEGWVPVTDIFYSGSHKPEASLDQYVKNCIEYARSPIELAAHEDLLSTLAAFYFLKAENPRAYKSIPKAVGQEISRRVWASKDVTLYNQYANFIRPDQAAPSKIQYAQLEKQMKEINEDIKHLNKAVYSKIDAMFDELCKNMELLPTDMRDARFIALVARVERAAEHTGYYENKNCPFEVAPSDETPHKPVVDDLKYSPELHANFETMLNNIDRSIFEFEFDENTRDLLDMVLQKPNLDNFENSPFGDQYKAQTKYRIKALQKFANNYDTVLANPRSHKVRDDYAIIAAQNALRKRAEIDWESLPEIELELVEQPKKSNLRTWIVSTAASAATLVGGLFMLDYFTKQEVKPVVEAPKEPEIVPKYTLTTAAQDITNVITKAPEAVNYVAEKTNDIATQIAKAFADAPSVLPPPTLPAPKSDIVLDFIWDKEPEPVPEMQLEPIPEIELEPVNLELDFSKPIQREPSLDLRLQ